MGAPYAQDLRDRVLAAYDRGMKTKQIAELFEVSSSWARRVKQRRRETGETSPRPRGGATVIKIDLDRLAKLVKQRPDATIKELHALLGVDCVESAVCMALNRRVVYQNIYMAEPGYSLAGHFGYIFLFADIEEVEQ